MQKECHPQLLQQAGAVVGGGAVHRQAHRHTQLQHLGNAGHAAGKLHVADGAVGHAGTGLGQQTQLLIVEMDAVGEPDVIADPAQPLHVGQRADALPRQHEVLLVLGLTQVGVEPYTVLASQLGALAQQVGGHGEGGAGGQRHTVHGAVGCIVVSFNGVDAVPQDLIHRLHYAVRRQAAVLLAEVHAAAAGVHADTQLIGGGELRPQQVAAAGGKDVVVVEAGGAAVLHQLAHAGQAGQANYILIQVFPDLIQGLQPVKQLHILYLW